MFIRASALVCIAGVACNFATPSPAPGQARKNSKDGLEYVWIPAGKFTMGCSPGDGECIDEEKPPHPVTITRGFWLGKTEVTVAAYKRFAKATHKDAETSDDPNLPMVDVSWDDATGYCGWAGMRLPTEAEWEYAARANTTGPRYGPLDAVAWHYYNCGGKRHPVGEKQPNAWGLYDMLGNVWEWVADWFGSYQQKAEIDPAGPFRAKYRTVRGGSWFDYQKAARASSRNTFDESDHSDRFGFRCAGAALK